MPKRITAVYVRVSTRRQDTESQEPELKRWLEGNLDVLRGDTEVRWYRDKFTGKTMNRPGFQSLMKDVELGLVERLVVWRLDRLGRTARGLVTLFDDLVRRKVNLVSIKDGLDLATPAGRLIANVIASVSAYDNEVRQENILAGIDVARSKGTKLGRKALEEGEHGKRIKIKVEQENMIRKLHDEGMPKSVIARTVGVSRPSVYHVLKHQ